MYSTKRKIAIITTIVIAFFAIMAVIYALASGSIDIWGKTTTGSVEIETINLKYIKNNGENVEVVEPSDYNTISWTTKNVGTAGILTRHTLEIIWNEFDNLGANNMIALYPANISKEDAIEDFESINSKYKIEVQNTEKSINGNNRTGIKYQFLGDILDGTDMTGVSKEVNYNLAEFDNKTDDNNNNEDNISFKLLISPKLSYLYQNKSLSIFVKTEAMQYAEDGNQEWVVVDEKQVQ